MASRSFENPLIPHVRMRAMYRAMVELRVLSAGLPRGQRLARQTEACWVAPAIGLEAHDLVSGPQAVLVAYIRAAGVRKQAVAPARSAIRQVQQKPAQSYPGNTIDRLFCAVGQAMAVPGGTMILAFAAADSLTPAEWQRLFTVIAAAPLPLVVTVLPAAKQSADLARLAAKAGSPPLPVIPVEAADPLALYRVAQEAIGRARAGGGAAVIECVASSADPVKMLAGQMLARKVNTSAWLAAVEPHVQALLHTA